MVKLLMEPNMLQVTELYSQRNLTIFTVKVCTHLLFFIHALQHIKVVLRTRIIIDTISSILFHLSEALHPVLLLLIDIIILVFFIQKMKR